VKECLHMIPRYSTTIFTFIDVYTIRQLALHYRTETLALVSRMADYPPNLANRSTLSLSLSSFSHTFCASSALSPSRRPIPSISIPSIYHANVRPECHSPATNCIWPTNHLNSDRIGQHLVKGWEEGGYEGRSKEGGMAKKEDGEARKE